MLGCSYTILTNRIHKLGKKKQKQKVTNTLVHFYGLCAKNVAFPLADFTSLREMQEKNRYVSRSTHKIHGYHKVRENKRE